MTHTIDATGKSLGRTASKAAALLIGKDTAAFARNKPGTNKVEIINTSKAKIDVKKQKTKLYEMYSGYPGGFRTPSMEEVIGKKGYSEVFKLAVYGMIPRNKLRPILMKNLKISE